MSAMRTRHSLGGTNGLPVDPLAELAADHPRRRQVDPAAQEALELALDARETEVPHRAGELGDEVEVAIRASLVAGDGAEDQERADAEPPKVIPVGCEELDGLGAAHGGIVGPGLRGWKGGAVARRTQGWTPGPRGGYLFA